MKRKVLFFVVAAAVLIAGCDPFGTSETKGYITGRIFADSAMTVPFEGAWVRITVNPDSVSMPTVSGSTNANGVFMLEVPFYPSYDESAGFGFVGSGKVGLVGYALGLAYTYAEWDKETALVIVAGDTLHVWDVTLLQFN
jgi:hypothetical protein